MRSIQTHLLAPRDRDAVLAFLGEDARDNLMLLDVVARLGDTPAPGEMRAHLFEDLEGKRTHNNIAPRVICTQRGGKVPGKPVGIVGSFLNFETELGAVPDKVEHLLDGRHGGGGCAMFALKQALQFGECALCYRNRLSLIGCHRRFVNHRDSFVSGKMNVQFNADQ